MITQVSRPGDFLEGLASTAARSYYITSPVYLRVGAQRISSGRLAREALAYAEPRHSVRYLHALYRATRSNLGTFNPVTGLIDGPTTNAFSGAQQSGPTALSPTPYEDISPRFGFAATLSHNLVVRGGFGLTFYPAGPAIGTLRNAPFNFTFSCSVQNTGQSSVVCPDFPIANTAVAEYGAAPSSPSSPVGQTGGSAVASGLPVPILSINNVFAPSAAQCTFTTNAAYSPTPSTGTLPVRPLLNPYSNGIAGANGIQYYTDGVLEGFNLQVQKEFGGNVVTLGYVGQLGRHAFVGYSPNHISNNLQNSVDPLATVFPWLAKTSITEVNAPWGTTSYNSLQAKLL